MEIKVSLGRIQPDNGVETLSNMVVLQDGVPVFTCASLELPWKDNQHDISCIPTGTYECAKTPATANIPYQHISILLVPNRAGCCIHKANFVCQLKGCICVGDKHVDINGDGQMDVSNSGVTYDKLMSFLPDAFQLIIT